jgi:hypothetical protein
MDSVNKKDRLAGMCVVISLLLTLLLAAVSFAEETSPADEDPIFGGQILSLTAKKEKLPPSNDPRFQVIQGEVVVDLKENLMWKQLDSYQELKKWMNWEMAQGFIKDINENRFAGFDDWRLPTRNELESLFEEDKSIPWKYYWTTNVVHIDPVFGYTSCCYWSSESKDETYAWTFSYIRGKAYPSPKGGPGLSLSAIRPVRSMAISEVSKISKASAGK